MTRDEDVAAVMEAAHCCEGGCNPNAGLPDAIKLALAHERQRTLDGVVKRLHVPLAQNAYLEAAHRLNDMRCEVEAEIAGMEKGQMVTVTACCPLDSPCPKHEQRHPA